MNHAKKKDRTTSYAEARELVLRTINFYVDCVSLPRLSTLVLDADGDGKHQKTIQPGSIALHFKADCEKITERVLADREDLQAVWFQIATGETPKGLAEVHLVQKLQKAYKQIDPWRYFAPPIRRGSAESCRRASA